MSESEQRQGFSPRPLTPAETGAFDEAAKYLRSTPVPTVSGQAPFDALVFPRIFYLRAVVAEKKGMKQVAEQNSLVFRALSGPKT